MSRALLVPVALALFMVSASCDPQANDVEQPDPPANDVEQYGPPVDRVNVTVSSCTPDRFEMEVDHWVAPVSPGRQPLQFQWTMERTDEVDAFEIRPVDTEDRPWPFDRPGRPQDVPPHAPMNMTIPPAGEIEPGRYNYAIVIHCGDRVYDIDPEIWIR